MRFILSFFTLYFNILFMSAQSIYDSKINNIDGDIIDFNEFKGKYVLFVNVASKCGFTNQYSDLERLHKQYKNDLIVIGFPCDQFGGQEPGDAKEIKSFCSRKFGVSFILTEKINVKGPNKHPIYEWLTNKKLNNKFSSTVKWNFQKYLLDRNGELLDYFYSTTVPSSKKIINYLN